MLIYIRTSQKKGATEQKFVLIGHHRGRNFTSALNLRKQQIMNCRRKWKPVYASVAWGL